MNIPSTFTGAFTNGMLEFSYIRFFSLISLAPSRQGPPRHSRSSESSLRRPWELTTSVLMLSLTSFCGTMESEVFPAVFASACLGVTFFSSFTLHSITTYSLFVDLSCILFVALTVFTFPSLCFIGAMLTFSQQTQ